MLPNASEGGSQRRSAHLKNDVELGVEVRLEALALQDGLELVQELEGVLDRGDVLEALVNKRLSQKALLSRCGV